MRLKNHFETMNMRDVLVAVPVGDDVEFNGAVKMNRTAAAIFELLKEDTTESDIVKALTRRFDAPQEEIAADVSRYLEAFRQKGLLTE